LDTVGRQQCIALLSEAASDRVNVYGRRTGQPARLHLLLLLLLLLPSGRPCVKLGVAHDVIQRNGGVGGGHQLQMQLS